MKDYGNGSVYQRSDGRWVASIFSNGKKRVRYAKPNTEKAARRLLRELWKDTAKEEGQGEQSRVSRSHVQEPLSRPDETASTVKTVQDFAEDWLVSAGLKATTEESYRHSLKAHVFPVLGDRRLDAVTASDVASLVATIQKGGASQRTAQYAYSVLRRLLQVATDWGIVPTNPAARVQRPRVEREERTVWSQAQAAAFLKYAKQGVAVWDDLFLVALLSGLRLGELLGLEWQDVDWGAGTIAARRNLVELDGGIFKVQTPKSKASVRTVSLPKDALAALRKRQEAQQKPGGIFRREAGRDRMRYNGIDANPIPRRNAIREAFRDACTRAGVPYISVHGLRHMHVTLLAHAGVSVREAQKRVGHSNPMMTLGTYTHVLEGADKRIAGKLDDMLGEPKPEPKPVSGAIRREEGKRYNSVKKRGQ